MRWRPMIGVIRIPCNSTMPTRRRVQTRWISGFKVVSKFNIPINDLSINDLSINDLLAKDTVYDRLIDCHISLVCERYMGWTSDIFILVLELS